MSKQDEIDETVDEWMKSINEMHKSGVIATLTRNSLRTKIGAWAYDQQKKLEGLGDE